MRVHNLLQGLAAPTGMKSNEIENNTWNGYTEIEYAKPTRTREQKDQKKDFQEHSYTFKKIIYNIFFYWMHFSS